MACTVCPHQAAGFNCQFSLDTALENIREHYKLMETSLQQKSKQVVELTERNNKLMKAIDCLKKPSTLARLNSFSEQCDRTTNLNKNASQIPSPIFEDITIIDDEEEDNALVSVMDTALNGSALNTTINNEVITETERPNVRGTHARRLALKSRLKPAAQHSNTSNISNDENKKPATIASPPTPPPTTISELVKNQSTSEWASKQKHGNETPVSTNTRIVKRLSLKQTRLPFDEKRERSPNAGKPTRTLTLGKLNKKPETNAESDEDVFDFNKSATFQFKSPTPKKSKLYDSKSDIFTSPKSADDSVVAIPSPTQTVYFLDDTTDEERQETSQRLRSKAKEITKALGEESADSLADFDMPDANAVQIKQATPPRSAKSATNKSSTTNRQQLPPNPKIKDEPLTQEKNKKMVNPLFKDSDTAEESDDDFMVRPIQIKVEVEQNKRIDIDKIDCVECRNYAKFCGDRMTTEKLEEHIRNCVRHNERNNLRGETPEGFWNPLMVSFAADDPRNEVLVDNRFVGKRNVGGRKKTS